jgi:small GTP-binding protein
MEEDPIPVKVVLLGESGVGKTSIISQFTANKFNPRCPTSVSAQFISKTIKFPKHNKSIKFDIWDTVGQEKYRSLAKIFYKDALIIIFVYDITTEFSFTAIKDFWYKETNENADNEPILALVANKVDLYKDEQITNDIGKAYADEINAIFQNTSALSNSGIDKLFENLGNKFLNPDFDYKKPQETNENVNSNENIRTGGKNGKNKDKNGKEKIKLKDEPKGTMEKKRNCC